jgi:hypothetical protein
MAHMMMNDVAYLRVWFGLDSGIARAAFTIGVHMAA